MPWRKHWREVRLLTVGAAIFLAWFSWLMMDSPIRAQQIADIPPVQSVLTGAIDQYVVPSPLVRSLFARYFDGPLPFVVIAVALLLGVGGIGYERGRGTAIFTLSLPFTRRRLMAGRFFAGAAAIGALSLWAMIVIAAIAMLQGIGGQFPLIQGLGVAISLAAGGIVVLSGSFLLANVTESAIATIAVGVLTLVCYVLLWHAVYPNPDHQVTLLTRILSPFDLMRLMSARDYVLLHELPVARLLVAATFAGSLLAIAITWVERQDF